MSGNKHTFGKMQLSRIATMKKLLKELVFISIALCQLSTAHAAGQCGINQLIISGFQSQNSNVFLYSTSTLWDDLVTKGYTNRTFNDKIYECDDEYCTGGTIIIMGSNHVFKGKTIPNITSYVCEGGKGNELKDKWVPTQLSYTQLTLTNANNIIISDEARAELDELCETSPSSLPSGYKCPDGTRVGTATFAAEDTTYPPLDNNAIKQYQNLIKAYEEELKEAEKVYEKQCGKSLLEKVLGSSKK